MRDRLRDRVVVLIGATSEVGRAIARMAAERGAKLVLTSRDEASLARVLGSVRQRGAEAIAVAADVAKPEEVRRVAEDAEREFGRIDAWINSAFTVRMGRASDADLSDERRLFEVNFWGVVHGTEEAVARLRGRGGTIVNLASVLSHRALPCLGAYSATHHAIKAYTDTLRMELESERVPIAIVLVKPTDLDAERGDRRERTNLPGPLYRPDVTARAVLRCLEHPRRDVIVGGLGASIVWLEKLSPRAVDRLSRRLVPLLAPRRDARRPRKRAALKSSIYTAARLHPLRTAVFVALVAGRIATRFRVLPRLGTR